MLQVRKEWVRYPDREEGTGVPFLEDKTKYAWFVLKNWRDCFLYSPITKRWDRSSDWEYWIVDDTPLPD